MLGCKKDLLGLVWYVFTDQLLLLSPNRWCHSTDGIQGPSQTIQRH